MSSDSNPMHLLALLVHRGYVERDACQRVAAALKAGQDLVPTLVQAAGMTPEHAQWLCDTSAGQHPRIPGFDIGPRLGQGGTAEVFQAKERTSGRTLVLKILGPQAMRQKGTVKAFVEEAKRLASLDHESLVKGFGVAKFGSIIFSKMECIDGETLQERLDRQGVFEEPEALAILLQVAEALRYLADQGWVHRDVKPGNIMITPEDRIRLIDLGFCARSAECTQEGLAVGTVEYLSPEQALGGAAADVRSDIYSLGVTLFQMTVGRLPFEGEGSEEVLRQHVTERLQCKELKGRHLSPQLQYFIEKMLDKEAQDRFQSYDELIAEIEAQLAGSRRLDYTQGAAMGRKPAPGSAPRARASAVRRTKRKRR